MFCEKAQIHCGKSSSLSRRRERVPFPINFQSISCLKKSIWISPTNFVCLYNLGLVFLTAQQYASAFHILAAASSARPDSAECFMLLGSKKWLLKHKKLYDWSSTSFNSSLSSSSERSSERLSGFRALHYADWCHTKSVDLPELCHLLLAHQSHRISAVEFEEFLSNGRERRRSIRGDATHYPLTFVFLS